MAKLYPPLIGGTIPAFYTQGTTDLVVPFSMNQAVGKTEISGFILKMKYIDGTLIDTFISSSYNVDSETPTASFNLKTSEGEIPNFLNVGQYYKIQLAYIGKDNVIGYYSTVGIIKCTTRPTVTIEGINKHSITNHQYFYTGLYSQEGKDSTEKLYSSRFLLTDMNGNVVKDTDYVLHNSLEDDLPYEARETFFYGQDLKENTTYYLTYSVKTMNGLEYSSPQYRIIQTNFVGANVDNIALVSNLNYENGYIKLTLSTEKIIISGAFLISRACSKDGWAWSEIKRFNSQSLDPKDWEFIDCTIEQGYKYKYSLQQYNEYGIYSSRVITSEIYADFEHAFLYDGKQQFKISYDPKITNFKSNLLENKVDTIGNKYPFILRNGNVDYKSFDIQGLISLRSDEENLFLNLNFSNKDYTVFNSDLTSENISAERIFKMKTLDWLNDGKPKLFRSPTEGNFIVRLLNSSLTPNDKLGRMIHSFKSTAYEISSFDNEHLQKYNIIDSNEHFGTLMRWSTIDVKKECKKLYENNPNRNMREKYSLINDRKMYSIKAQNFQPGTIIYLDNEEIMIGVTGAYIAESEKGFNSISIIPNDFLGDGYDLPIITYGFKSKAISLFGLISKIEQKEVPLQQFIGQKANYKILTTYNQEKSTRDILKVLNNQWNLVSSLNLIRFKRKDVYQVFVDCEDPQNFNPNTYQGGFFNDEELKQEIDLAKLSKMAIYLIRCKRSNYKYRNNIKEDPYAGDPYNNEGYYIDKENEVFAPYTQYFLDGNYNHYSETPSFNNEFRNTIFNVTLNETDTINLREIQKYNVQEPNSITSIIIGQGIIAELSYILQVNSYYFDTSLFQERLTININKYNELFDESKNIVYEELIKRKLNNIGEMSEAQVNQFLKDTDEQFKINHTTYHNALNSLYRAIEEYNERNGIQ